MDASERVGKIESYFLSVPKIYSADSAGESVEEWEKGAQWIVIAI